MDYEPLTKPPLDDDYENGTAVSSGNELALIWDELLVRIHRLPRHRQRTLLLRLGFITLLITAFISLTALLVFLGIAKYHESHIMNFHLRQVSTYSPIHDLLDLNLHTETINGSFFPSKLKPPSIARHLPNPTTDQIWEDLSDVKPLTLTKSDILRMGNDPSTAVHLLDEDFGLGDDAYGASLDIFHHIHCLNSLRKIVYGTYYNTSTVKPEIRTMKSLHVNHCIDLLLQTLQCSGNVNYITWHWVENQPYPFPDMSVNRKCVDFGRLVDWQRENSIDRAKYDAVTGVKPKGVKERPAPDALYAWSGVPNPNHVNGANEGEDFNI
ncbi:protein of unknown function (DUF3328) domain containing protein [Rhypophila sp. PSN 637]